MITILGSPATPELKQSHSLEKEHSQNMHENLNHKISNEELNQVISILGFVDPIVFIATT